MPKIVTIRLLVAADIDGEIADGLNEALREITHPMGSGTAADSFILDYTFDNLMGQVPEAALEDLSAGAYQEGVAFQGTPGKALFLLATLENAHPSLTGPFTSEEERIEAARNHRHNLDAEDGLYRLDVLPGEAPDVNSFYGGELDQPVDPLVSFIADEFKAGREPITVLLMPRCDSATVLYQGDEVLVNAELLDDIERHLGESLVQVDRSTCTAWVPMSVAAKDFLLEDWQSRVNDGVCRLGFEEWVRVCVNKLHLALESVTESEKKS